jgi:beta-glucosidase
VGTTPAGLSINFKVTNVGSVSGAEVRPAGAKRSGALTPPLQVSQAYIGFPAAANEPPKMLRAFAKTLLTPDETAEVSLFVDNVGLSVWDASVHDWSIVPGTYTVLVGASAADIRLQASFTM